MRNRIKKRKKTSLHRDMGTVGQVGKGKKKEAEMLENKGRMRESGTIRYTSNKNRGTTQEHLDRIHGSLPSLRWNT